MSDVTFIISQVICSSRQSNATYKIREKLTSSVKINSIVKQLNNVKQRVTKSGLYGNMTMTTK